MRIISMVAISIMVSGCNSQTLRQLGAGVASVAVVQTLGELMSPSGGGGGSSGGRTGSGGDLEGCDSPEPMRDYLNQLHGATPGFLGWDGLFGGIATAREHCATYQSIQPLMQEECQSIGYGYKACPAIADGRVRVWTVGRSPSIGTGLN